MNDPQALPWIPLVVPFVVAAIKAFFPKIPKAWLPILCPFIGAGLDLLASGTIGANTAWGAALGSAGVGIREAYDQVKKAAKNGKT